MRSIKSSTERIYVKVNSDFDNTGHMQPALSLGMMAVLSPSMPSAITDLQKWPMSQVWARVTATLY